MLSIQYYTLCFIVFVECISRIWLLFCFFPPLRNDGSEFNGSIYQKVNEYLETAVNLAWTAGSNSTRFGIAAKYQLDSNASLSVSTGTYW